MQQSSGEALLCHGQLVEFNNGIIPFPVLGIGIEEKLIPFSGAFPELGKMPTFPEPTATHGSTFRQVSVPRMAVATPSSPFKPGCNECWTTHQGIQSVNLKGYFRIPIDVSNGTSQN